MGTSRAIFPKKYISQQFVWSCPGSGNKELEPVVGSFQNGRAKQQARAQSAQPEKQRGYRAFARAARQTDCGCSGAQPDKPNRPEAVRADLLRQIFEGNGCTILRMISLRNVSLQSF